MEHRTPVLGSRHCGRAVHAGPPGASGKALAVGRGHYSDWCRGGVLRLHDDTADGHHVSCMMHVHAKPKRVRTSASTWSRNVWLLKHSECATLGNVIRDNGF